MGKVKPFAFCIVFLVIAIVFLILTIAVPVALIVNPGFEKVCDFEKTLNRGEQYGCILNDNVVDGRTWVIDVTEGSAAKWATAYRTLNPTEAAESYIMKWKNFDVSVRSKKYVSFPVSAPRYFNPANSFINITCRGYACSSSSSVKLHWLSMKQFDYATQYGYFDQSYGGLYCNDFDDGEEIDWQLKLPSDYSSNYYFYLILSNTAASDVRFHFSLQLDYKRYNTKSLTPLEISGGKVKIKDLNRNEMMIVEYPSGADNVIDYNDLNPPPSIQMQIHDIDVNWSGVILSVVFFGLVTIVAFILAIHSFMKVMKKMGKIKSKGGAAADPAAVQTVAPAAAAAPAPQPQPAYPVAPAEPQPQPAYPVAGGPQPAYPVATEPQPQPAYPVAGGPDPGYPGQPAYPGQPEYPGQPAYPGQPGPAAV